MEHNLSVNVRLIPEGCEEATIRELMFSGDTFAVLVEHTGEMELSVTACGVGTQEDLHQFFAMMAEVTRGE